MKQGFFNNIKQVCLLLMATAMLFKAFLAPAVFIDFKLNQDYITKVLCINREKPQLNCEGQCVLMQKMKNTQDGELPGQSQNSKTQLLEIFSELTAVFLPLSVPVAHQEFFAYNEGNSLDSFSKIFHPPILS